MRTLLLDTHAWAWTLVADPRLSNPAVAAIQAAGTILVSPVSFFEIAQKVRVGKWPEMEPILHELPAVLGQQGGRNANLMPAICITAGVMSWDHRDPFDRLLAATALYYNLPIVSADPEFDGVVTRLW